jgi:urea transporter
MSAFLVHVLAIVLRGLAQVFLLRSAAAGLLLLCGLTQASLPLACAAVLGSAFGSGLAVLLGQPRESVRQGLHGYNAALVAMAMQVLFRPTAEAWLVTAVAMVLMGLALPVFRRLPVPVYTTPFVLVLWATLAAAPLLGLQPSRSVLMNGQQLGLVEGLLHGMAQVMFVQDVPAGLCVVLAVALESPRLAVQVLVASALGLGIGTLVDMPEAALTAGLAGFNAVLCVLALARDSGLVPPLVAAAGATLLSLAAQRVDLPALTGPFILCTWAALLHARQGNREEQSTPGPA